MHRGQNPDYHRTALTQGPFGPPPVPCSAFPGTFGGRNFPPHYPNPGVFPSPAPAPAHLQGGTSATCPSFTEPVYQSAPPNQFQQGWSLRETDLEVKKKAEEFLRILEAKDRLDISDALEKVLRRQSAEDETDRRSARARSRSRNRSRSRDRSRGKSRGRSRARSRSRSRSRARSRSRGKSRTRAKSRARSRSRSRGRSAARSKSQCRLEPHRGTKESSTPPVSRVPDLFQNLKQVLQRTDLEKHLDLFENACATKQSPTEMRVTPESLQKFLDLERPADLSLNSVLPHERAGGPDEALPRILLWDGPGQKEQTFLNKCELSSVEDEERFLYGDEEGKKKPQAVTVPLAQTRPVESPASSPQLAKAPPLPQARQPEVTLQECEKVKNLLKTIGLNLGMADICKMAARMKQKQEEQRGASSTQVLRNTLETLNCGKVQTSEDTRSVRSGSSHSLRDLETKEKMEGKDRREKQIQEKRKEYLVKELEGLLKHEGTGDLIPVIGFFCKKCEEFFGDLCSAKGHKHKQKSEPDGQHGDEKRSRDFKPAERKEAGERKKAREEESPHRTRDHKEDESGSEKSAKKKKKKKDKKMKKKEKKEKKKGKEKGEKKVSN